MSFSLRYHSLLAHWVPGFIFVMGVRAEVLESSAPGLHGILGLSTSGQWFTALTVSVAALASGQAFDAGRDLLEHIWDHFQSVNWSFFIEGGKDRVEQLDTWYFTYYVFDCNLALVILTLALVGAFSGSPVGVWVAAIAAFVLLVANAVSLRTEIADRTQHQGAAAGKG